MSNLEKSLDEMIDFYRFLKSLFPIKWSSLKPIMNSRIAKLTIIVPVIGWLIVHNDYILHVMERFTDQEYENIQDALGWKTRIFYIGLLLISIATILFTVFCPKDIVLHDSDLDFCKNKKSIFTEKYADEILGKGKFIWITPPDNFKNNQGSFPLIRLHAENEEEIINCLRSHYKLMNCSWPIFRVLCMSLFVLGIALSTVPAVHTAGWASCSIIKDTVSYSFIDELKKSCLSNFDSGENHLKNMKQPIFSQFSE